MECARILNDGGTTLGHAQFPGRYETHVVFRSLVVLRKQVHHQDGSSHFPNIVGSELFGGRSFLLKMIHHDLAFRLVNAPTLTGIRQKRPVAVPPLVAAFRAPTAEHRPEPACRGR